MPDERGGHTQLHHARGHDLLHEIKRPGATQKFSSNSAKRIRLHPLQLGERCNLLGQALGWTATRPERRRFDGRWRRVIDQGDKNFVPFYQGLLAAQRSLGPDRRVVLARETGEVSSVGPSTF